MFESVPELGDMSECNAALVLMSLSHSPNSSIQGESPSSSSARVMKLDFVTWMDAAFEDVALNFAAFFIAKLNVMTLSSQDSTPREASNLTADHRRRR